MTEFPETPREKLQEEDWSLCVKKPFLYAEDIFVLEGRASLAGVKHSCRAVSAFGLEHLNLGDNLGNILALEKRPAHVFSMLCVCRSVAAYALAFNAAFAFTWLPSELNVADKPSRA